MNAKNGMRPVHLGEVLREELNDLWLSGQRAVERLGRAGQPGDDDSQQPAGA